MSFNINSNSYNSYLSNNTAFSSDKISKMEKHSTKSLDEVKKEATTTITKNGKTYYVVKVDGEAYLYDYENDNYTKFSKDTNSKQVKETTYNAQSKSISIADSQDNRRENYSYNNGSFSFITANRDTNIFAKNVTVIDSFTNQTPGKINDEQSVSFSHGEIVSAILEASGAKVTRMHSNLDFYNIDSYLQKVLDKIEKGEDVDTVNLSLSVGSLPELLNANEINFSNADILYERLKNNPTQEAKDVASIINKIKLLSNNGVSVHISAGNEANDSINSISGYNKNKNYTDLDRNGKVEGRDYNAFNLLTLAAGSNNKNVHVIGSSNEGTTKEATLANSANYSNYNQLVDKLYDGDINFKYVSKNSDGTHKFYIEGVGYYSFRLSDNEVEALKNKSFTVNGTSFATPLSIAKNDTSLR